MSFLNAGYQLHVYSGTSKQCSRNLLILFNLRSSVAPTWHSRLHTRSRTLRRRNVELLTSVQCVNMTLSSQHVAKILIYVNLAAVSASAAAAAAHHSLMLRLFTTWVDHKKKNGVTDRQTDRNTNIERINTTTTTTIYKLQLNTCSTNFIKL